MATMTPQDFVQKWGLNEAAAETLQQMDLELQQAVMQEYMPREQTRNASDLFIAFARSRTRSAYGGAAGTGVTAGLVSRQDVENFVQKWNLNADSYACLLSLPMDILDGVIRTFFPREKARDINNLFQAFAQSRLNNVMAAYQNAHAAAALAGGAMPPTSICPITGQPLMTATGPGGLPLLSGMPAPPADANEFFLRHPSLNERSMRMVEALGEHHPAALKKLMASFNPFDITRDANDTFLSFWKPRAMGALVDRYCLNKENAAMIKTLDIDMFISILKEFGPPRDAVSDMDNLFATYVSSRLNGLSYQLPTKPAPTATSSTSMPNMNGNMGMGFGGGVTSTEQSFMNNMGGMGGMNNMGGMGGMCGMGGMGMDNMGMGMGAMGMGSTASMPIGAPIGAPIGSGSSGGQPTIGLPIGASGDGRKRPMESVSGFVNQYNLGPSSEQLLNSLQPHQQAEVVQRFMPKANTRDIDGLFRSFVQSVQMKG